MEKSIKISVRDRAKGSGSSKSDNGSKNDNGIKNGMPLTEGRIVPAIIKYTLPLIGASLIQQLYSTVDLIFAGQFIGKEATAAIGATSLIVTCLIVFFNGLATGSSILTAQYYGAGKRQKIANLMSVMLKFSLIGGLFLTLAGFFLTPVFLRWVGTPDEIMGQAITYLRIYVLSMTGIVSYNMCGGIIRALGDSKNPMLVQIVGSIVNLVGNTVFVAVFSFGVAGVAWATFCSQNIAAAAMIGLLLKKKKSLEKFQNEKYQDKRVQNEGKAQDGRKFQDERIASGQRELLEDLKPKWQSLLGAVMKIGIPAGIQSMSITFSNILMQSQINGLGVDSIAAFTCYFKVEMIIYLPVLALAQTMVTFTGQNYGAGKFDRLKKGCVWCMLMGLAVTVFIAVLVIIFNEPVLGIFTKSPEVISIAAQILVIAFASYFLYMIIEGISAMMRGFGDSFTPMIVTIICFCFVKVAALFYFSHRYHTAKGMALCYPVSWMVAVLMLVILLIRKVKKWKKDFHASTAVQ